MIKKIGKKVIFCMIAFMLLMVLLKSTSFAATFSVSASKTTLNIGDRASVTINGSGCFGQFKISSSDSSVISVSEGQKWIENASSSVTITAKKAGKATITVTAASVSDKTGDNEIKGSKSVTINVSAPKEPTPSNNNSNNNSNNSKSSDATLKSITVGGKSYSNPKTSITASSVSSATSSIKISAVTNNSKAKVTGTGTKDLVTGTNKFTLKVTAENGATQSYTIRITRLAEESNEPNLGNDNKPKEAEDQPAEEPQVIPELRLTNLSIEGVELIPVFNSETFEYSVYITEADEIKINTVANVEGTNIEVTGNTGLVEGENIVIIKLTKDDKQAEYKIKVSKSSISAISEEIKEEDNDDERIGFVGGINDWWNRAGPATLVLTITLVLFGIATIFAIIAYKYSNDVSRHSRHSGFRFMDSDDN